MVFLNQVESLTKFRKVVCEVHTTPMASNGTFRTLEQDEHITMLRKSPNLFTNMMSVYLRISVQRHKGGLAL